LLTLLSLEVGSRHGSLLGLCDAVRFLVSKDFHVLDRTRSLADQAAHFPVGLPVSFLPFRILAVRIWVIALATLSRLVPVRDILQTIALALLSRFDANRGLVCRALGAMRAVRRAAKRQPTYGLCTTCARRVAPVGALLPCPSVLALDAISRCGSLGPNRIAASLAVVWALTLAPKSMASCNTAT
jgi:hypothetical protein